MSVISRMRRQKAVYWPPAVEDDYGRPVMGTAVEIDCRWEDEITQFVDAVGPTRMSRSVVYPDMVLAYGGLVWEGELKNLTSGLSTQPQDHGALEIHAVRKIPNLKATENLHIVML